MGGGATDLGRESARYRAGNGLGGVGCNAGDETGDGRRDRGASDGDGGDGDDGEGDSPRRGDRVRGRAVGDSGRGGAERGQAGHRDGRDRRRVGLGQRAWAVGHGQGGSRGNGVRLVSLDDRGGERAVGRVRADRLGRGDEDAAGGVDRWNVRRRGERSLNGARAFGDGQSLAGSRSIGDGALGEGGRLGAVGGVDVSRDGRPHDGIVGPRESTGDEAEDRDKALHGFGGNDCVV